MPSRKIVYVSLPIVGLVALGAYAYYVNRVSGASPVAPIVTAAATDGAKPPLAPPAGGGLTNLPAARRATAIVA